MNTEFILDEEELEILEDYENNQYKNIKLTELQKNNLQHIAKYTFEQNKTINIKISEKDFLDLKKAAMLKTIEEQLADLRAMSEDDIDLSDIPDCSQLAWDKATTGKFFRAHQTPVTIDNDVFEWFMNTHENINDILRQYMLQHQ